MGLTTSLNTAMSGLSATQVGIGVISENIAGAKVAGYVRRAVSTNESAANGSIGVSSTQVQRQLSQIVQRQLWQESAGSAYTGVRADALASLDQLYGTPGSSTSLDAVYSAFTNSLQALQNDPSSYTNRTAVLDAANELATRLNGLSNGIQSLRTQSESGIANAVTDVNQLLNQLASVNSKVVQGGNGSAGAELKDQRDRILSDLSGYMDIRTVEDSLGSVTVSTASGTQIFDGRPAVIFSFDQHPSLTANSQWSATAADRTVGTITINSSSGNSSDAIANKTFRSGSIAAYVDLRDNTLAQAQSQLDEIAAHLASALSDRQITGAVTVPAGVPQVDLDYDLGLLERGNTLTFDYKSAPGNATQRLTFVNASDPNLLQDSAKGDANNRVIAIDFSGGTSSVASQLQTQIDLYAGAGFTVSNPSGNVLRIVDGAASGAPDLVGLTASPTVKTVTSGNKELPFFVDGGNANGAYTGSLEGRQQFTGFAGRITLNPTLVSTRSNLVVYGAGVAEGDSARPKQLLERLNNSLQSFTRFVGVDGSMATSSTTVSNYVQRIVASQGQSVTAAQRLDEGQKVAFSAIQSRFNDTANVNVDQEMSLLIELQTAYAANARVISSVKEMLDVLLRI